MPRMRKLIVNPLFTLSSNLSCRRISEIVRMSKAETLPTVMARFAILYNAYIFFLFLPLFFEELLRCEIVHVRENHEFLRFGAVNASCASKLFFQRKSQSAPPGWPFSTRWFTTPFRTRKVSFAIVRARISLLWISLCRLTYSTAAF